VRGTTEGTVLEVQRLRVEYDGREVLHGVDLTLRPGEILGIVGPNGSGKSTVVRALSHVLASSGGTMWIMDREPTALKPPDLAKLLAVVPQSSLLPDGFTALDVTLMGRTPYLRLLQGEGPDDVRIARQALLQTASVQFADRPVNELSGGERQLVVVARALTQQAPILLMDEPTAHLDINHQIALLDLVSSLAHDHERSVIAVIHDLTLASQYCDRMVVLNDGRVVATGTPHEVIHADMVEAVYGAQVAIIEHPVTKRPVVIPVPGKYREIDLSVPPCAV
jgi:iron complex transport system ATP-binding protein